MYTINTIYYYIPWLVLIFNGFPLCCGSTAALRVCAQLTLKRAFFIMACWYRLTVETDPSIYYAYIISHCMIYTCTVQHSYSFTYLLYSSIPFLHRPPTRSVDCGPTANTVQLSLVYRPSLSSGSPQKTLLLSPEVYPSIKHLLIFKPFEYHSENAIMRYATLL